MTNEVRNPKVEIRNPRDQTIQSLFSYLVIRISFGFSHSTSGSTPVLVLGKLEARHIIHAAFDPFHVAITHEDVPSFSAMIIIFIGIVVDRAGTSPVAIHDQPDLRGADGYASQTKLRILMDVALHAFFRFFYAADCHPSAVIPMPGLS